MKRITEYLLPGQIKAGGIMDKAVNFTLNEQLKKREIWHMFNEVFTTHEDDDDLGWRGEFYGKMMRGATLIYKYTQDKELYDILTEASVELLNKQDSLGRISGYSVEKEFSGWDMWGRKYVITGLLHYSDICKDEALKQRILTALCKHLDYIVSKVGDGEGKISVVQTSHWWGGLNAASILEPVVEMYKRTNKREYLEFAGHILSTGGCRDGSLTDLALKNVVYPYMYPTTKAYEMMSFFEGVLAYYEVTGDEKCFKTVDNFVNAVLKTDVTLIGCCGCSHELFDNSTIKQTGYSTVIMQETCVTVTLMRLLSRMYLNTGNVKYIEQIENSGLNALYGSMNTERQKGFCPHIPGYTEPFPFDSYSPLYKNRRGNGVGGYKEFKSGGSYGCCVSIAACAVALMPLTAVMKSNGGYVINFMYNGEFNGKDKNGNEFTLKCVSGYPADCKAEFTVISSGKVDLKLYIRRPEWCSFMKVNGKKIDSQGYYLMEKSAENGEKITVEWGMEIVAYHRGSYDYATKAQGGKINFVSLDSKLNDKKVAFAYGPLTLGFDALKNNGVDIFGLTLPNKVDFKKIKSEKDECVRFVCNSNCGDIVLTDYQSCGKKWLDPNALVSVWIDEQ